MRDLLRWILAFLLCLVGCATVPPPAQRSQPSPTPTAVTAFPPVPSLEPLPQAVAAPQSPGERLDRVTLGQAIEHAERIHPELALGQAQIESAEGRALQAGLLPNPELVARLESAPLTEQIAEQAEYVVGISQTVPLGRRLTVARRAELLDRDRLRHALAGKRLDIRMRVQSAFATALYWQRVIQARSEDVRSAANGVTLAQARLAAGETIPAEVAQAEMERRRAELERDKATFGATQAVNALGATLGDATLKIASLEGTLEGALAVPTLDSLAGRLDESPLMAAAEADIAVQRAQMDLAHAQRAPDMNLELFYRRLGDTENAVDVGVRMPLGLFDRAQGRIRETRAELTAAEARAHAIRNELSLTLQTAHGKLERAVAAAMLLRVEIIPRAESVLQGAEARYRTGDISLTELLPVRRDWTRVRLDYLEALHDVMQAWAELSPYMWER